MAPEDTSENETNTETGRNVFAPPISLQRGQLYKNEHFDISYMSVFFTQLLSEAPHFPRQGAPFALLRASDLGDRTPYLRADSDGNPRPFLERAHVLREELFGEDGILPTGAEGAAETVVVLERAPRDSGLETLLRPRRINLCRAKGGQARMRGGRRGKAEDHEAHPTRPQRSST